MIKLFCSECNQECIPEEHNGVDDGDYYYESDCCKVDVMVYGEHMEKPQYEQWIEETLGF